MKLSSRNLTIIILVIVVLLAGISYSSFLLGKNAALEIYQQQAIASVKNNTSSPTNPYNPAIARSELIFWTEYDYKNIATDSPDKWLEPENLFSTNDVARAQEHVPFTIVLPRYVPSSKQRLPIIYGQLKPSNDMKARLRMTYTVFPDGIIIIYEEKYRPCPSNLVVEGINTVEIDGKQVKKNKNNTNFYFDSADVSFSLSADKVPGEGVLKVVKSMLQQIK